MLNERARSIGPSPTMQAANAASRHPDCIDLSVGEPAELPPAAALEAASRALAEGKTRYGPPAGLAPLRAAIAADQSTLDSCARSEAHVLVTPGGKAALHDVLRVLLEPGDEVLIFAPYWPTFADQVRWSGAIPVVVPPGPDLRPDPAAIEDYCTERTRLAIINSPANPSGRVMGRVFFETLAELSRQRDLFVVVDQVYHHLTLDEGAETYLEVSPDRFEHTLVVESFSKRFAMTGMRLGAAIGPAEIIAAMVRLTTATYSHTDVVVQAAGLAALLDDATWIESQLASYRQRRTLALEGLKGIAGLHTARPEAAFYLFPDLKAWLDEIGVGTTERVVDLLRDEAGVRVVPGAAFGAPTHIRLSWGVDEARLKTALDRLAEFFRTSGKGLGGNA